MYEFVGNEGLSCLLKVGLDSDPTFCPYILKGKPVLCWYVVTNYIRIRTVYVCHLLDMCCSVCSVHCRYVRTYVPAVRILVVPPDPAIPWHWCYLSFNVFVSAIGEIIVYVDGMNGLIRCPEVIEWLYSLIESKVYVCVSFFALEYTYVHTYVCF